ncbi:putative non-specific serine/threonine protein kinase [Medicago truncatula]|uniref:Putative non-specific serine/threonine protein kinase n=1 Tax=Medicago truncatula TaxID=3880 RepID=A0A396HMN3_MEDTR|nr:putative non-specific serine/threonine protein kinase [Medicago truncatula]
MSSLTGISVEANSFSGSLPPNMFNTLPNLYFYGIGGNQFSGPIPTSIANAYTLIRFDIGGNHFVGQVPCLGKLQKLWSLSLQDNKLGDNSSKDLEFLKSLANCSQLYSLSVTNNNFGGSLPNLIGNLSPGLSELYIGGNQIYGKIPIELGNLTSLDSLNHGR